LHKTVNILVERQILWENGSKGLTNNPMTWKAYQEKNACYQASVDEYLRIGQQLNEVSYIIF